MKITSPKLTTKVLWLTDLHLDRATDEQQSLLLDSIAGIEYDKAVISGDISNAKQLCKHLRKLADACAPRPLYFVLGNHDYHGGSVDEVDEQVFHLCKSVSNLNLLDGTQIIKLGKGVGLIGNRGWADMRAGYGPSTILNSPDRSKIEDFRDLAQVDVLEKMRELGRESARVIRRILPLALTRFRHVVLLTHVPPFSAAVIYNNKPCSPTYLPHFVNLSMGFAIRAITRAFPRRRVTVLAGHSHSSCVTNVLPNLSTHVGSARTGSPNVWAVIEF